MELKEKKDKAEKELEQKKKEAEEELKNMHENGDKVVDQKEEKNKALKKFLKEKIVKKNVNLGTSCKNIRK